MGEEVDAVGRKISNFTKELITYMKREESGHIWLQIPLDNHTLYDVSDVDGIITE